MSSQAQHYYWAGGHGLVFFTGMRYLLAWSTFKSGGLGWWYKSQSSFSLWLCLFGCIPSDEALRCVVFTCDARVLTAFV
jgi:hypothetical protein